MSKTLEDKLKKIADNLCTPKNEILYNVTLEEVNLYLNESAKQGYELCQKEYEEKLRWIPVEEKLPEIGDRVLLKNEFYEYVGFLSKNKKDFRALTVEISDSNEKILGVTHWRSFL